MFIRKTIWLMLYQEIICIYSENHTKLTQVHTRDKIQFNITTGVTQLPLDSKMVQEKQSCGHSNNCMKWSSFAQEFFCCTAAEKCQHANAPLILCLQTDCKVFLARPCSTSFIYKFNFHVLIYLKDK
jgi:hypothetical protein